MKLGIVDRLKIEIVGWVGASLLWLMNLTFRWRYCGEQAQKQFFAELGQGTIFVFWHNCQLFMPFAFKAKGGKRGSVYSLISSHRDGRYIARASEILGCNSVAGSSTRGGSSALKKLARVLKGGNHVAITPDGPKGPIYEAKPGAVHLARLTKAKIYPLAYAASRSWQFNSWDRMFVPKPFAEVVLVIGEEMSFNQDQSHDDCLSELNTKLRRVTDEAHRIAERK